MDYFSTNKIQEEQKQTTAQKKHTLLLVDDEVDNLEALAELLKETYHILTATDGQMALDLIKSHSSPEQIHLIITDQRMPELSGVEFLQQTISIIPQTKRIILTGFTDINATIDAINQGQVFKFITKPFDPQDMLITVKRALEAYELEQQNLELIQELKILNGKLEQKIEKQQDHLSRKLHVETMKLALLYWEMTTQKTKSEFAAESKIWSHYIDEKGTLRSKTLNRYLHEKTLPQKPKTHLVMNTAQFVLDHCPIESKLRPLLETHLEELKSSILSDSSSPQ